MSESESECAQRRCPGGGGVCKDADEDEEEVRARCLCVTICAYVGVEMSAGLLYSLTEEDDDKVRWRRG
jgi:hypothetical protein